MRQLDAATWFFIHITPSRRIVPNSLNDPITRTSRLQILTDLKKRHYDVTKLSHFSLRGSLPVFDFLIATFGSMIGQSV